MTHTHRQRSDYFVILDLFISFYKNYQIIFQSFDGIVDFGEVPFKLKKQEIATESLVYMVNCINGNWKLPIAHFFTTSSLNGASK